MNVSTVTANFGGKSITLETGRLACQADGSVLVKCGNNMVLATVVSSKQESGADFFPLTVEYSEKFYATGKIPGGYFKREGRPTSEAILNCRLIDRPMRPCFPEGYNFETQIVTTILSADGQFPLEILATLGASAAVHISDIPFNGPIASAQVAKIDGKLIVNPSLEELEKSDFNIVVSGTENGLLMVEGEAQFISEKEALEALKFGHEALKPVLEAQESLRKECGCEKRTFTPHKIEEGLVSEVCDFIKPLVSKALTIKEKRLRYETMSQIQKEALEKFLENTPDGEKAQVEKDVRTIFEDVKYAEARNMILNDQTRIDGRNFEDVRPISCEVGLFPRTHGSAVFTRGETQVVGTVTLGTTMDEQIIDALHGTVKKNFMLHYNFPPFSVGETGRMGGQSRREIGHGFLASRAISSIIPNKEEFPYTIRMVGEVLASNGSSSMGTVCSGLLALLDAGVPVKANVAGIAMGLIKEGESVAVLSDILGDEDHLGDMDFKVAGTHDGITALQMDIKIDSLSFEIMEKALNQALAGRRHILQEMEKVMKTPRGEISPHAPRVTTFKINPEKVREVIGAGGKVIRSIIEETGVKVNIEDDGQVQVASTDSGAARRAIQMIEDICAEAEVGKVYKGKIVKITDFGAFVEVLPNTSGLLHISEVAHERIRHVSDVLKEGEEIDVKVLDVDRSGRIRLSRKAILNQSPH